MVPVVCVFGVKNITLVSEEPVPEFETNALDCRCYLTDDGLYEILARDCPVAIVSFGNHSEFQNLGDASFHVKKKWTHYDNLNELDSVGRNAFLCYVSLVVEGSVGSPLVTVFTPTFKTGDRIYKPLNSLLSQTYKNWEWVIMDDSDDEGQTFEMLTRLTERDSRIRVYKNSRHTGIIGKVKRDACFLGQGEFLVELDHDDELTSMALERVVNAYEKCPDAGFVYTDFSECFEDGSSVTYPDGWGFGYGSYREEIHGGHKYMVVNSPNVNPKTIRHIVAAPNHLRSWRRSVYDEIGGHNSDIHVADDYEIMVRTFLATRMARVPHLCYVQYRNFDIGNTHQIRNQEIHRLVRFFSQAYDNSIHARFEELGVDDFIYEPGRSFFNLNMIPNRLPESHCSIIVE